MQSMQGNAVRPASEGIPEKTQAHPRRRERVICNLIHTVKELIQVIIPII